MSKHLKQINLRLMNSSKIPSAFYKNNEQTNLMLLYNNKALKEKLDKILGKFQLQQRKFLQRNFSCGTYDSRDQKFRFPFISHSSSPRHYFYWDDKVSQSISMKKNKQKERIINFNNYSNGGSTKNSYSHYHGLLKKTYYSISDFARSFKITNYSFQLKVNKVDSLTDRKVVKLRQEEIQNFKEIPLKSDKETKHKNSNGCVSLMKSKLFENVFLRNKMYEK